MGAFRGSITYSQFFVRGDLPADYQSRYPDPIAARVFRELDPAEEAEYRVGWCSIEDPFDLELTQEKVFFNGYLNLGFRIDTWRIPRSLFKGAFRDAERQYLATQAAEKLTRAQKKDLEAVVVSQLKRKLVPAMKVIDLSWGLDEGTVRFFQQSPKTHALMEELFEQTFGLELVPAGAYVNAEQQGLPDAIVDALPALEPTLFHRGGA
ncbi:MAG: hypothetical protein AB8I08_34755 [Sandaracinaceae bacterium]